MLNTINSMLTSFIVLLARVLFNLAKHGKCQVDHNDCCVSKDEESHGEFFSLFAILLRGEIPSNDAVPMAKLLS